jgi:peptide/nickel transport system substrate-binding protein
MNWTSVRVPLVIAGALSIVATACAPSTAPSGASPAATAAATAAATVAATAAPARGGTVVFAVWQEPTTLAPIYANQTVAGVVGDAVTEGLAMTDPEGTYVPVLAKSVPTVANGGVTLSSDGKKMTVKWELQPGLKWSDGKPVTSQDIVFTWQTYMKDPKAVSRAGFSEIEKIDTPDDVTALVAYKSLYGPYPTNFYALLPKHLLEKEADISKSDYNRKPLGTGPFKITEFKAGDSIVAERNENYRKPGKPYLDKIIFRSVPSSTVAIAQLKAGEVQGMWNLLESETPDIEKEPTLKLSFSPSNSVERIEINLAENADPADPSKPHPILGDVRVRRALIHATPKQQLVDKLLFGKAKVGSSVNPQGWAADKTVTQEPYDPKKADELLDQAGWTKGPDGIRAKGGVKMSLTINTTTGNKTREQVEQVLVDEWKQRGIELKIVNMPSSVFLSGSWDDKDPRQRGTYDLALYTTNAAIDPGVHMSQRYHSRQIPTAQNKSGQNRVRISDGELDKMIDEAGNSIDQAKRKELYGKIFRKINEIAPAIWLYERGRIDAFRTNVLGWVPHAWGNITWNTEDWSLKK